MTGPACGNNPHHRMTDGDRQAVDSFRACLAARVNDGGLREKLLTSIDSTRCDVFGYTPEELLAAYDASRTAPADPAALRDRIADILAAADGWTWAPGFDKTRSSAYRGYLKLADSVLAVLPATTDQATDTAKWGALVRDADRLRKDGAQLRVDAERIDGMVQQLRADRAAVLREAADVAERLMDDRYGPDCSYAIGGQDVARELRRVADETATTETQAAAWQREWDRRPNGADVSDLVEVTPAAAWDAPDARPGTTDHTLAQQRAATLASDMCPRCKGDNSEAWELCATCAATDQPAAGARQDGAPRPGLRARHRTAWAALTPEQQAARLAELDADEEPRP